MTSLQKATQVIFMSVYEFYKPHTVHPKKPMSANLGSKVFVWKIVT